MINKVHDFDGVVYQYLMYKGEDWKKCERCNSKWFKPKNNRQTFCKSCWKEREKELKRETWHKNKEKYTNYKN